MTCYLPIWLAHCTRVRFTVLVSCSDEFTVRQFTHVRSVACWSRLLTCEPIVLLLVVLHNNNITSNLQTVTSSYGSRRLPHVIVERRCLGSWYSETVTADSGKPHSFTLCERSMIEPAVLLRVWKNPLLEEDSECGQQRWSLSGLPVGHPAG